MSFSLSRAVARLAPSGSRLEATVAAVPSPAALEPSKTSDPAPRSSLRTTPLPRLAKKDRPIGASALAKHTPLTPKVGVHVATLHFRSHTTSLEELTFFTSFALRAAKALALPTSNVIALPTRTSLFTVPRSPFAHKKSQENFWRKEHKRAIKVYDGNEDIVELWLAYLRKEAMGGVGMKAQLFRYREVGYGQKMVTTDGLRVGAAAEDADKVEQLAKELIMELETATGGQVEDAAPRVPREAVEIEIEAAATPGEAETTAAPLEVAPETAAPVEAAVEPLVEAHEEGAAPALNATAVEPTAAVTDAALSEDAAILHSASPTLDASPVTPILDASPAPSVKTSPVAPVDAAPLENPPAVVELSPVIDAATVDAPAPIAETAASVEETAAPVVDASPVESVPEPAAAEAVASEIEEVKLEPTPVVAATDSAATKPPGKVPKAAKAVKPKVEKVVKEKVVKEKVVKEKVVKPKKGAAVDDVAQPNAETLVAAQAVAEAMVEAAEAAEEKPVATPETSEPVDKPSE